MEQLFMGRVPIERAASFFEFHKGSDYQKILHQLKYKGQKEIGEFMGNDLLPNFAKQTTLIRPIIFVQFHFIRRESEKEATTKATILHLASHRNCRYLFAQTI